MVGLRKYMQKNLEVKRKKPTNMFIINSVENIGKYEEYKNHPQSHHPEKRHNFGDSFSFLI